MLRITVHDKPGALTFQLEGSLAGAWVRVLEECWQGTLARRHQPDLRVDLIGHLYRRAGRACLAAMHRQGGEFIAPDCLMKATVAEITQTPGPDAIVRRTCDSNRLKREHRHESTVHVNSDPAIGDGLLLPGLCR
jgi:hypothetical protein